jgi:hypothetical protein
MDIATHHGSARQKQVTYTASGERMDKKTKEGVPALQNDDVTGMTEERQDEVIRKSGRAPRKDAAEEFYDEQGEQALETPAPTPRKDR